MRNKRRSSDGVAFSRAVSGQDPDPLLGPGRKERKVETIRWARAELRQMSGKWRPGRGAPGKEARSKRRRAQSGSSSSIKEGEEVMVQGRWERVGPGRPLENSQRGARRGKSPCLVKFIETETRKVIARGWVD